MALPTRRAIYTQTTKTMEVTHFSDGLDWGQIHAEADAMAAERLDQETYLEFRRILTQPAQNGGELLKKCGASLINPYFSYDQVIVMGQLLTACSMQAQAQPAPALPEALPPAPSDAVLDELAEQVTRDTERGQVAAILLFAAAALRVLCDERR